MNGEQSDALREAVEAFGDDKGARSDAVTARRRLKAACKEAHRLGVSDAQLATAFGQYSRARIQQLRTKEST